jgi:hypothetical protein
MSNIIIDILIEILNDYCSHSLKNENNFYNLYDLNFPHYKLYCHLDINDGEYKLCNSCREIIDININKSVFFRYIKNLDNNIIP